MVLEVTLKTLRPFRILFGNLGPFGAILGPQNDLSVFKLSLSIASGTGKLTTLTPLPP